ARAVNALEKYFVAAAPIAPANMDAEFHSVNSFHGFVHQTDGELELLHGITAIGQRGAPEVSLASIEPMAEQDAVKPQGCNEMATLDKREEDLYYSSS
ncbi:MAG: hypothetical protein ACRD4K_09825, partial [Candidatus Acidiferrales bacterium]